MFRSPFSGAFWRQSVKTAASLRVMVICAMCMAASIVLGYFYVPISDTLTIRFTYLATATAGLVAGPVGALLYGFAVDILGFVIHPQGTFFFGYTLSAMFGALLYALFFYRQRLTVLRMVLCRILVNYGVNVALGAFWSSLLYSKGYLYYLTKSLVKNTVMLPIEVAIMAAFFSLLLPAIKKTGIVPAEQCRKVTWL